MKKRGVAGDFEILASNGVLSRFGCLQHGVSAYPCIV